MNISIEKLSKKINEIINKISKKEKDKIKKKKESIFRGYPILYWGCKKKYNWKTFIWKSLQTRF